MMSHVANVLNQVIGGGIEGVLDTKIHSPDHVSGRYVSNEGVLFNFEINGDDDVVTAIPSHEDSEIIDDYFRGRLLAQDVEYHGDSAYLYYLGRNDSEMKLDFTGGGCPKGGVRCGKRCLPRGQQCRINAGGKGKGIGDKVKRAAAEAGDFLMGNTYTDLRQRHAYKKSGGTSGPAGKNALKRIAARIATKAALVGGAAYALNKSQQANNTAKSK